MLECEISTMYSYIYIYIYIYIYELLGSYVIIDQLIVTL